MATIIQTSASNVSTDINANKKKNITKDENNMTIEQVYHDKSKCESKCQLLWLKNKNIWKGCGWLIFNKLS